MADAARSGAQLIVVPEGTVPAYVIGTEPVEPALIASALADVAAITRRERCTVVYGSAHVERDGTTYNAAYVVGPDGALAGVACKRFLWHFDRRWFTAGTSCEPVDTAAGRLGVLVCADGRIPTIAGTLVDRGAQMLVMPTAWVTSGRDPAQLENIQADLMINVRARENAVPVVAANKVGTEAGSVAYCGKSIIVAADGTTLARGDEHAEAVLFADVEPSLAVRSRAPLLAPPVAAAHSHETMRIAITPERDPQRRSVLEQRAAEADADAIVIASSQGYAALQNVDAGDGALQTVNAGGAPGVIAVNGTMAGIASYEMLCDPRALVAARLAGVDVLCVAAPDADEWTVRFARTRATELRAYVVVVAPERAFACDPDGTVVCGTFGEYALASFAYDPGRTAHGLVAPATDVFAGLREAELRAV